jgi:hypothetical protein
MRPQEPSMDGSESGISRRKLLKRIGGGAVVAWSAPIITSLATPAFALSPPSSMCDPDSTCEEEDPCRGGEPCQTRPNCWCFHLVEDPPHCSCVFTLLDTCLPTCARNADCPPGAVCVASCCPRGTCFFACGATVPLKPRAQ